MSPTTSSSRTSPTSSSTVAHLYDVVVLQYGATFDGFVHVDDWVPQRLVTATGPSPLPRSATRSPVIGSSGRADVHRRRRGAVSTRVRRAAASGRRHRSPAGADCGAVIVCDKELLCSPNGWTTGRRSTQARVVRPLPQTRARASIVDTPSDRAPCDTSVGRRQGGRQRSVLASGRRDRDPARRARHPAARRVWSVSPRSAVCMGDASRPRAQVTGG
jgi:hypothetical protein